jgi:hypothetical protein
VESPGAGALRAYPNTALISSKQEATGAFKFKLYNPNASLDLGTVSTLC